MKLFSYGKDGGPDSTVWGYWLCEFKSLFSIAILCFEDGSREAYHSHAFNCFSWLIKGHLTEENLGGKTKVYRPNIFPILTRRETFHKVTSKGRTWVFTIRGPWSKTWKEFNPNTEEFTTLTNGRKEI